MTCKLMAGDAVLLEQEYYSVGRRIHRVEGLPAAEEGAAEVPVLHDEGAVGARREEQPVDRAGRDGE